MLVIYPRFNTDGRSDATGAFLPKAREFLAVHRIPFTADHSLVFDNSVSLALRMENMRKALRQPRNGIRTIAFFCHGWKDGIQCGFRTRDVPAFAAILSRACAGDLEKVILYACDTGRDADADKEDDLKDAMGGDGGFADLLRDEFKRRSEAVTVFAHSKTGHTTACPYMRVFAPGTDGVGGPFVVSPESHLWPSWRRALAGTDLWARFPFMGRQELEAELEGEPSVA